VTDTHTLAMLEWAWAQPEHRSTHSKSIDWRTFCVEMVVESMRKRRVSLEALR